MSGEQLICATCNRPVATPYHWSDEYDEMHGKGNGCECRECKAICWEDAWACQKIADESRRTSASFVAGIVAVGGLVAGLQAVTSMLDYCDYCDARGEVDAEVHGWVPCCYCKGTGLRIRAHILPLSGAKLTPSQEANAGREVTFEDAAENEGRQCDCCAGSFYGTGDLCALCASGKCPNGLASVSDNSSSHKEPK